MFIKVDFVMSICNSIDATVEDSSLGRLVNHGEKKERNCKMVVREAQALPYLCLFAIRDIKEHEEILYDYGIKNLPWKVSTNSDQ